MNREPLKYREARRRALRLPPLLPLRPRSALWVVLLVISAPACGTEGEEANRQRTVGTDETAAGEARSAARDTGAAAAGRNRPGAEARASGVAPGTTLRVRLATDLGMHRVEGDTFTATTIDEVRSGQTVAIPAGAAVHGTVTAVQAMEDAKRPGVLKLDFRELELDGQRIPLYVAVVTVEPELRVASEEAAAVVDSTARALLGRVLTADEADLTRETVRAASGSAIVLAVPGAGAVLPAGSEITLRLEAAPGG